MDFMNFVAEIDGVIPTRFFGFEPAHAGLRRLLRPDRRYPAAYPRPAGAGAARQAAHPAIRYPGLRRSARRDPPAAEGTLERPAPAAGRIPRARHGPAGDARRHAERGAAAAARDPRAVAPRRGDHAAQMAGGQGRGEPARGRGDGRRLARSRERWPMPMPTRSVARGRRWRAPATRSPASARSAFRRRATTRRRCSSGCPRRSTRRSG